MKTPSTKTIVAAASVALVVAALAAGTSADPQPYAGLERREIKALSPTQIEDYRAGRGMSLALAAELNGYPGPRHVLDLAEPLGLTPEQQSRAQALFDGMQQEAAALGDLIVAREAELDARFADATAGADAVESLAVTIGRLNGELRFIHLRAHLAMRELLSPAQIEDYSALRGYRPGQHHGDHGGRH